MTVFRYSQSMMLVVLPSGLTFTARCAMSASALELLIIAFEAATAEDFRLKGAQLAAPVYQPEQGFITLDSVAQFKEQLAEYQAYLLANEAAKQELFAARAALDAWFPAAVIASLDEGVALVAPATEGVIALVRHNEAYIIERGHTQEEALNKIERFLNQF